jgi:hypothetical protein
MQSSRSLSVPVRIAAAASLIGAGGAMTLGAVQHRSSLIAIAIVLGLSAAVALIVGAGPRSRGDHDERVGHESP